MRQTLHILWKDLTTLWMELSISLVALSFLTWSEWRLSTPARTPRWYLEGLPVLLLFLAWWFLIVRLIHAEAPVGDRQFWVTRPYIWYKLLAAKALFMLGCIGVPLLVSQTLLISAAGVPVSEPLVAILRDTGITMLVGILPVAAIASITRSLGQWALYTVTIILGVIGITALGSSFPNSQVREGSDVADLLEAVAVSCLCAAAISVQYASRKAHRSMLLLVAALISVPVIIIGTPYRRLIESAFPIVNSGPVPVHASFEAADSPRIAVGRSSSGKPELTIPVQLSVPRDGTLAMLDAAMLSIDLFHGHRWKSEWRPVYGELIESAPREVQLRFEVDRNAYEKSRVRTARLRLSLAFSQYRDANRHTVVLYRNFDLPGVGSCWIDSDGYAITCRSTETRPSLLLASVRSAEDRCQSDADNGGSETCAPVHVRGLESTLGPLTPLTLQRFPFR